MHIQPALPRLSTGVTEVPAPRYFTVIMHSRRAGAGILPAFWDGMVWSGAWGLRARAPLVPPCADDGFGGAGILPAL